MKSLYKVDTATSMMVIAGAIAASVTGLIQSSQSKEDSLPGKAIQIGYGITAAAALYKLARMVAPKTKKEQRLHQISYLYNQAEKYQGRAAAYRRIAEIFVKRRLNHVKSAISS